MFFWRDVFEIIDEIAVSPPSVNRTVTPRRPTNRAQRTREHLTPHEVEQLIKAMSGNRNPHRDGTMVLMAFRHALRVSELCDLRWEQVDFNQAVLHVRRVKNGTPATHPLTGREMRALRRLQREQDPASPFMFVSERGSPFSTAGVAKMLRRAATQAGLDSLKVHPHMLRHAAGFKLANDGVDTRSLQAYLGHRHISNTVRYSELSSQRFRDFWQD
jgi:site-specific recombinase XerD